MSRYLVTIQRREFDISFAPTGDNYTATVNKKRKQVSFEPLGGSRMLLTVDNQPSEIDIRANGYDNNRLVFIKGTEIEAEIEDYRLAQVKKVAGVAAVGTAIKAIKAPMPGLILEMKVSVGDKVRRQQPLAIIEAMKMENIIKSPVDAVIKKVAVLSGQSVEKNDLLIEFE